MTESTCALCRTAQLGLCGCGPLDEVEQVIYRIRCTDAPATALLLVGGQGVVAMRRIIGMVLVGLALVLYGLHGSVIGPTAAGEGAGVAAVLDNNYDGSVETMRADTDYDGSADTVVLDRDEDGQID